MRTMTKLASTAAVLALAFVSAACDPAIEETKNADMTQPVDRAVLLARDTFGIRDNVMKELSFEGQKATLSTCKEEGEKAAKEEGYSLVSCLYKDNVVGVFKIK